MVVQITPNGEVDLQKYPINKKGAAWKSHFMPQKIKPIVIIGWNFHAAQGMLRLSIDSTAHTWLFNLLFGSVPLYNPRERFGVWYIWIMSVVSGFVYTNLTTTIAERWKMSFFQVFKFINRSALTIFTGDFSPHQCGKRCSNGIVFFFYSRKICAVKNNSLRHVYHLHYRYRTSFRGSYALSGWWSNNPRRLSR